MDSDSSSEYEGEYEDENRDEEEEESDNYDDGYQFERGLQERLKTVRSTISNALDGNMERNELVKEVEALLEILRSESHKEGPKRKRLRRDEGNGGEPTALIQSPGVEVDAALSNELILKNIFKYMSFKDLKGCKHVNPLWNKIGNETLARRSSFVVIPFTFTTGGLTGGNPQNPFTELMTCMEKNETMWPSPGIILDHRWGTKPEAAALLKKFGNSFRRLRVDLKDLQRPEVFSALGSMLEKSLPNLVALELTYSGGFDEDFAGLMDTPLLSEGTRLPALERLRMPNVPEKKTSRMYSLYGRVVQEVLFAAVNLKLIENFNWRFTRDLIRLNKLRTVQDLQLNWKEGGLNANEAFVLTEFPCIKRVWVTTGANEVQRRCEYHYHGYESDDDERREERKAKKTNLELYKTVLDRCRNSLEEMEIAPIAQFRNILPCQMSNLKLLTFSGDFNINKLKHNFNFDFKKSESKKIFPALKEVRINVDFGVPPSHNTGPEWTGLDFLEDASLSQAKVLRIRGRYCSLYTFIQVERVFPHLQALHVHWPGKKFFGAYGDTGNYYCKFWKLDVPLRILEIIDFSLEEMLSADSFFTGLAHATCRKLQSEPKLEGDLVFFRQRESISRFWSLRKFKLVLSDVSAPEEKEIGLLSHVSYWYGFRCIRKLKVVVGYNFRHAGSQRIAKAIEGVRPFATVVHEET